MAERFASRRVGVCLLSAALSACADLAPVYERPALSVDAVTGASPVATELGWRDFFAEPRLRSTIGLAPANNRDLRVAALNVQSARAQYRIQGASKLPTLTGGATATRSGGAGFVGNNLSVSANLSAYELDLFGRIKNLNAAALQIFLASDEARRSVQISLVAETASSWL